MAKTIKLKKGYNIKIKGSPEQTVKPDFQSRTFAVKPTDFVGIAPIPKLAVQVGDEVKAGDLLFFDKQNPDIYFVAPVSGEVVEIVRGEKRSIVEIIILADQTNHYQQFDKINLNKTSRDQLVKHLLKTGCWPFLRQRPFNVLAEVDEIPKNIFISAFDSAPLAPDYNFTLNGLGRYFQAGIDVLAKLTDGKVHISTDTQNPSTIADNVRNAEVHSFKGIHPAGCVGIQIHHIAPINKGDVVWTINPMDVVAIGRVLLDGQYNTERYFAVGGPKVKQPQYVKSFLGANIADMLKDNLITEHVRTISGNVLTGKTIAHNGHINFFDHQLSVLEEGDQYELFGWLIPNYLRPSLSRTFPAFLMPNKEYDVNTNTHGEPRAFVATGLYEKVLPMDVFPMHLLKAIMFRDFDLMEGLGIYEVVEEDLALCEFVCPSKTNIQEILRDGLDYMREQA